MSKDDEERARPRLPSIPWREESAADGRFLAQIIDTVAHPIFVKDRQFRWVLLNRAFAEMVGYPRSELLGKTDYEFFPREEADFFRKKDVEMFESGRAVVIEEEPITDRSGRRHVLSTTKVPLVDDHGRVTHLIGIISDITHLKAVEEALRNANEDLERRVDERTRALATAQEDLVRKERLAVLGRLAGGVAHQIRNPLGVIKNAAYLLERSLRDPAKADEARKAIAIVHDEIDHANQIITGLLEYARVRAPVRSSEDAAELVREALDRVPIPPDVRVEVHAELTPHVAVDRDQVCGALENLVRNSIESMGDSGVLVVETRAMGKWVAVVVRDTGPGVAPEVRERLFEPLLTTKATGLGLGLVTARTLVEGQGGKLRCLDAGPPGAAFEVLLPVSPSEAPPPKPS